MSETSTCCTVETELDTHWNDPGQDALLYRVGTWSDFYSRLKYGLSRATVEDDNGLETRPLAALSTRAEDDPTIGLLDAWSMVLDVLTFYQERIANEGFLRTAIERESVLYLARSIGYELSPGVAASTRLAFTVEDAKGAPGSAIIAEGLPVLHIPGQDETPQTFETVEEREVRAEWNAMTPVLWEEHPVDDTMTTAYIAGVTSRLQPGDRILVVGNERAKILTSNLGDVHQDERWDVRVLTAVTTFPAENYTLLEWAKPLGYESGGTDIEPAADEPKIYALRVRTPIFGHNAPPWLSMDATSRARWFEHYTGGPWSGGWDTATGLAGEEALASRHTRWPDDPFRPIYALYDPADDEEAEEPTADATGGDTGSEDEPEPEDTGRRWVDLDGEHKGILADSWVVFVQGEAVEIGHIISVTVTSRADFALSGKVTRLEIDTRQAQLVARPDAIEDELDLFRRRRTVAFAESEELTWSEKPISAIFPDPDLSAGHDAQGYQLSTVIADLEAGMYVFVTGEVYDATTGATGETATELLEIASVATHTTSGNTVFTPVTALTNAYVRNTVTMNANVVLATHGETVSAEVLGSGDGSQSDQAFTLRKSPLTFVSAATVTGSESTLTLRVDGVQWEEVSSLYDQDAEAELFVIRVDNDAKATVSFGDGVSGARLPTGQENVTATYRFGLGDEGNVDADTLKLMKKRPLGVKAVTNPLAAEGGEDPERLEDARENAPRTVLTLDRLVSLSDYEDFARAFAGVAKARAFNVWAGEQRRVHLTVSGVDGATLSAGDETYDNLLLAIKTYRDPTQRVEIKSCAYRYFRVRAELSVDSAYVADDVFAAAKDALATAFAFEARSFAQAVTAAEVVTLLQAVPGVLAVDLNSLELLPDTYDPGTPGTATTPTEAAAEATLSAVIVAARARWDGTSVAPAELLLLDTSALGVTLEEMN